MAVAVYHMTKMGMRINTLDMLAYDVRKDMPTVQKGVLAGFREKRYFPVAVVPTDDLEVAYRLTNSIDDYWGENADIEICDTEDCPIYGKAEGHRSSMMGDLFVTKDGVFMVATFGFDKVFDLTDPRWIEFTYSLED